MTGWTMIPVVPRSAASSKHGFLPKVGEFMIRSKTAMFAALLSLPVALAAVPGGAAAAAATTRTSASSVTSSSLGDQSPTFTGPAATGCAAAGCSLLSGPYQTPSTRSLVLGGQAQASAAAASTVTITARERANAAAILAGDPHTISLPAAAKSAATPTPPAVSCKPAGAGCDQVGQGSGGATGVTGLTTVDSAKIVSELQPFPDIEPPDQGLCAGNGYIVESDNIGEILIFNTKLQRISQVIPLDTLMGLTGRGWSSGGDISCLYDASNGGHWFFTEFASTNSESSGGAFAGCFNAVANACREGLAVTRGNDPFGPYNVYFVNADYNPNEPGYPFLLNDFAKIGATRDAFLLFYDEFPLTAGAPGFGGGGFNGAQEFAFDKTALELGWPVAGPGGAPNRSFTVAIENMGLLATPNGTCAATAGVTCWFAAIPAQAADPSQWDNSHGGSGFMMDTLDYFGQGDTRIAAFDWTGLSALNNPADLGAIRFGGQLFSGTEFYIDPDPLAAQKAGPIPLGDECGAAGLSAGASPPASCPEGGIATNGDFMTQLSQAQGQLWGGTETEADQMFGSASEVHQAIAYWVVGTRSFDTTGVFTLSSQGYVSAAHEDVAFAAIGAGGSPARDGGAAVMAFTLTGNDFYPSTAYGRLTSTSGGLLGSVINVADLGKSPQDGFGEYLGYPGPTSPRWGDYSWAIYYAGRVYFAGEYIPHQTCTGSAFTLTIGTCGGTRDGFANWGTSVNSVVP
jgi:hypothetical protein